MAQRKSPSSPAKKPGGRPLSNGASNPLVKGAPGARPPARKPGKSIVNQKQTPWGLIITTVVIVVFAAAIVIYAVTRSSDKSSVAKPCTAGGDKCYTQPEIAAAKKIPGVIYKVERNHDHVSGVVKYDTSPPIGGNHSQYWAVCTGTVYDHQIANENAVHMLEHGAVWITYNPATATAADISTLKSLVEGNDRLALSPYAGLKTPISLQAWNYQLFVNKASDKRVTEFIDALKFNYATTPEPLASCSDPGFDASKSTPGNPFEG